MSKIEITLIIAQNGLATAARLLNSDSARKESKGDTKGAAKNRRLAKVLEAADAGIKEFMAGE